MNTECVNLNGSFHCACLNGYLSTEDGNEYQPGPGCGELNFLLCPLYSLKNRKVDVRTQIRMISFVVMCAAGFGGNGSAVADPGFSPGGAPTPKIAIIFHIFAENCMKMKEFGPPGGRASLAPPLGSANGQCVKSVYLEPTNHMRVTMPVLPVQRAPLSKQ